MQDHFLSTTLFILYALWMCGLELNPQGYLLPTVFSPMLFVYANHFEDMKAVCFLFHHLWQQARDALLTLEILHQKHPA